MKLEEIYEIVGRPQGVVTYKVKFADGKTELKRFFICTYGHLCVMAKNMKKRGYQLEYFNEYRDWVSIEPYEKKVDLFARTKKRAQDALGYLNKSGLWGNIKTSIEHFLSDDNIIREFIEDVKKGSYEHIYLRIWEGDKKYGWLNGYLEIFEMFMQDRCWKTINYDKHERQIRNALVNDAIKNGKPYHHMWTKQYDNDVEVKLCDDGIKRAWYSEEYRNCSNGHYYLLFDAVHAIFYEND